MTTRRNFHQAFPVFADLLTHEVEEAFWFNLSFAFQEAMSHHYDQCCGHDAIGAYMGA